MQATAVNRISQGDRCVPAELLNTRAAFRLLSEEERDELDVARWRDIPMRGIGL